LRDYISNMGWKTKDKINKEDDESGGSDEEDEEFLDKVDEFETKYNFRFEEEGGHSISSHARQVNDSVRVKDSKRKRQRDEKKERKEAEKKAKIAELQRLKNMKKAEIESRLKEIEQATGNKIGKFDEDILDTEFDPDIARRRLL
jgi:protein KRI1